MSWQPSLQPGSVKICGLREPEHAETAARAGADLIGFIFAPSKRYILPEAARLAIDAARRVAQKPLLAVGVFVNEGPERINEIADIAGLDVVQLSGDEEPDIASRLARPFVRALRLPAGSSPDDAMAVIARWDAAAPVGYLLDAFHEGLFGGTGEKSDWLLAASVGRTVPIVLAGGLSVDNVGSAIETARPLGVDVSSGVEVAGRKDHDAITGFVHTAKAAFRSGEND